MGKSGADNEGLTAAKRSKSDEFYTQWVDIEKEVAAYVAHNPDLFRDKALLLPCDDPEWSNFTKFFAARFSEYGIKRLVSTSCTLNGRGRKFVLDQADVRSGSPVSSSPSWEYLDGDGDFRSDEVTALRDEADIVMTNPPFSLFRDFLSWLAAGQVQFSAIGNVNAVTYREVFPLIKNNQMWLGPSISSGDREFRVPDSYPLRAAGSRIDDEGNKFIRVKGVRWFTNIDHGRRHEPLTLMTTADNVRFSKHRQITSSGYQRFDNYDAIEVPFTDAIPSDHDGVMGVPITFLDKYDPDQFDIVGCSYRYGRPPFWPEETVMAPSVNGVNVYKRILIQHKAR